MLVAFNISLCKDNLESKNHPKESNKRIGEPFYPLLAFYYFNYARFRRYTLIIIKRTIGMILFITSRKRTHLKETQ